MQNVLQRMKQSWPTPIIYKPCSFAFWICSPLVKTAWRKKKLQSITNQVYYKKKKRKKKRKKKPFSPPCATSVQFLSGYFPRRNFGWTLHTVVHHLNRETDWLKGNSEWNLTRSICSGRFELNWVVKNTVSTFSVYIFRFPSKCSVHFPFTAISGFFGQIVNNLCLVIFFLNGAFL